jgi:hypothetical protein
MTCIVGVVTEDGRVVMGGDSAGVAGFDITVRADQKVFHVGEFLLGFTTSFRMGQLLRFRFTPPAHPDGMDTYEYMVTLFVDAVRTCFKTGGYAETNNGVESGGTFLVGYRGRLFCIDFDYQVGEASDGYDAVGCGCFVARGSLFTSNLAKGLPAASRVRWALEAAAYLNAGVRAPFTILEQPSTNA